MSSGVVVLIGVTLAVVLGLARMWRSAEARASLLSADKEKLVGDREELTARLSREVQARKKQSGELAAQRKRVDKAKKRKAKGVPDLPLGTASRIGDLEDQIERVERERDRSRAEREQLAQQVAQLEARVEFSARAAEAASAAKLEAVTAVSAAESDAPVSGSGLEAVRAELSESRERASKLAEELEVAKQAEVRMRKRMNNQERLYASIRAELDVKKDRLRAQEEKIQRLQALKVAVAD